MVPPKQTASNHGALSHNDPGWLMTFEEFFAQRTQCILNTKVNAFSEQPARKFIWAEISFLSMWWSQATQDMRLKMKRLIVDTKQLEIFKLLFDH